MKRQSIDEADVRSFGSSQELEFDTQSFISKEEPRDFKPFAKERDNTGKLILKEPMKKEFQFLKGQQIILSGGASKVKQHSTTHLLGLQTRIITPEDQSVPVTYKIKNFKLHLTADQGFIRQFREYQKQITPSTNMNRCFLTTNRDYYSKISRTPGPGVYDHPSSLSKKSIHLTKSPQYMKPQEINCQQDFYDFKPVEKQSMVLDFQRVIGRDEAYQKSIFAQLEIQQRENRPLKKEEDFDERKIDKELEYLRHYQAKYGKLPDYQKQQQMAIQTKRLQQPEQMHLQWTKMLEKYGFKNSRGMLVKQQK